MPSRQERRKAERDAAKRDATKRASAQARAAGAGGTGGAGGSGGAGAAHANVNMNPNPVGDWTTQAADPFVFMRSGQGLTLVHCSAQLEPCLTHKNALHTLNTP
jgi:hypothetical protein